MIEIRNPFFPYWHSYSISMTAKITLHLIVQLTIEFEQPVALHMNISGPVKP